MKTTTKKHWQNGHQLRGGWFHTLNLSAFNYGVMLTWGTLPNTLTIQLFKLI